MNRFLSFFLVVFATTFGFILYVQQDVGRVSVSLGVFEVETSLLVFGTFIFMFMFLTLFLFRFIGFLKKHFIKLATKFTSHFEKKILLTLSRSIIELVEGQYDKSEKWLSTAINNRADNFPLCLVAAAAAHRQENYSQRDEYLQLALANTPGAEVAIDIIKTEFYLDQKELDRALDILLELESLAPKNTRVLTLLTEGCRQTSNWSSLLKLTPRLSKYRVFPEETIYEMEMQACFGLVEDNASPGKAGDLDDLWSDFPSQVKASDEFLVFYVRALHDNNNEQRAYELIQQALNKSWQDSLIETCSSFVITDKHISLEVLEKWLTLHPANASLLHLLGKTCLSMGLWGKARSYLEASLAIKAAPETCWLLARLLEEQLDDHETAIDYYKQGLGLATKNNASAALDAPKPILKIVSPIHKQDSINS